MTDNQKKEEPSATESSLTTFIDQVDQKCNTIENKLSQLENQERWMANQEQLSLDRFSE